MSKLTVFFSKNTSHFLFILILMQKQETDLSTLPPVNISKLFYINNPIYCSCSYLGNSTIIASWWTAGRNFSITSLVFSLRLDVLMHGWHPNDSSASTSLSISNCTRLSLSFISPIIDTDPGVISRNSCIYSSSAKESLAELICFDKSFVLKTLSPGIISI